MLLMRGPGGFTGGKVLDAMVSQLDLYPTICDVAEAPHPDWLQGRSLLPLVHGETDRLHDELFAEMTYHAAYEPLALDPHRPVEVHQGLPRLPAPGAPELR